ncbi:MAG: DUF1549 domain-containing protein [Saprospiraceae bacterium]|nr:DUF1549 domain-containing protein [Saprospiraceae bacterium]
MYHKAFLGINLKCASCHNSFVNNITLEQSYGFASIFSTKPLEMHRCDALSANLRNQPLYHLN